MSSTQNFSAKYRRDHGVVAGLVPPLSACQLIDRPASGRLASMGATVGNGKQSVDTAFFARLGRGGDQCAVTVFFNRINDITPIDILVAIQQLETLACKFLNKRC